MCTRQIYDARSNSTASNNSADKVEAVPLELETLNNRYGDLCARLLQNLTAAADAFEDEEDSDTSGSAEVKLLGEESEAVAAHADAVDNDDDSGLPDVEVLDGKKSKKKRSKPDVKVSCILSYSLIRQAAQHNVVIFYRAQKRVRVFINQCWMMVLESRIFSIEGVALDTYGSQSSIETFQSRMLICPKMFPLHRSSFSSRLWEQF